MFQSISLCRGVLRNVSCVECFLAFLSIVECCGVVRSVSDCFWVLSECFFVLRSVSNISYCFVVFLCVP